MKINGINNQNMGYIHMQNNNTTLTTNNLNQNLNNNPEKIHNKEHKHRYHQEVQHQIQQHNIQQQVAEITGTGYNINLSV